MAQTVLFCRQQLLETPQDILPDEKEKANVYLYSN